MRLVWMAACLTLVLRADGVYADDKNEGCPYKLSNRGFCPTLLTCASDGRLVSRHKCYTQDLNAAIPGLSLSGCTGSSGPAGTVDYLNTKIGESGFPARPGPPTLAITNAKAFNDHPLFSDAPCLWYSYSDFHGNPIFWLEFNGNADCEKGLPYLNGIIDGTLSCNGNEACKPSTTPAIRRCVNGTAAATTATTTTTTTIVGAPIRTSYSSGAVSCDEYCRLGLNDEAVVGSRCVAAARGTVSVPAGSCSTASASTTKMSPSTPAKDTADDGVACIACTAVENPVSKAAPAVRDQPTSVTCWCDPPDNLATSQNTNDKLQPPKCTKETPCKIVLGAESWRVDNLMNSTGGWDPRMVLQSKECDVCSTGLEGLAPDPATCSSGESKCCNGKCVDSDYIQDGDDDCGDGSDESSSPFQCSDSSSSSTCDSGYSECCNGRCINSRYIRDGGNDCGDYSDETNPEFQCDINGGSGVGPGVAGTVECREEPYFLNGVAPHVFRQYLRYTTAALSSLATFAIPPAEMERLTAAGDDGNGDGDGDALLDVRFSIEWNAIANTSARYGGPGGFYIDATDGSIPKGEPRYAGYYDASVMVSVASKDPAYHPVSTFKIKSFAFHVEGKWPFQILNYGRNRECTLAAGTSENAVLAGTTAITAAAAVSNTPQSCASDFTNECWPDKYHQRNLPDCYAGSSGSIAGLNLTELESEYQVGDQLTFSLKGAPPGFSVDSNSGRITVAPPHGSERKEPYMVELVASDDGDSKALVEQFEVYVLKRPVPELSAKDSGAIVGGLLAVIVVLLCLVAVSKYKERQEMLKAHDFKATIQQMLEDGDIDQEHANQEMVPREIKRSHIALRTTLGQGAFGEVKKGVIDESSAGGPPGYLCAVKTVKEGSAEGIEDLLQEATVMAQVGSHANVVSMIGVVTSGEPAMLVISFCEYGSLKDALRKASDNEVPVAPSEKNRICMEVAGGMAYLHSKRFIHRDLAARNVLLATGMTAKVADFGLSRAIAGGGGAGGDTRDDGGGKEYYRSRRGVFPVRWTAIEAMDTLIFNAATDVWSFGITMNEVWWDGQQRPYSVMTNKAIQQMLTNGERLAKPTNASDAIYQIMLDCWKEDPAGRPSFAQLVVLLRLQAAAGEGSIVPVYDSLLPVAASTYVHGLDAVPAESNYSEMLYKRVVTDTYESLTTSSPLRGLAQTPAVGLREAIANAMLHYRCNNTETREVLESSCTFATDLVERQGKGSGLSVDQAGSVNLYTKESIFYRALNGALGGWGPDGRAGVVHYLPYIKLAIGALKLLPAEPRVVYRGVTGTPLSVLLGNRKVGDTLTWWAFTSTTGTSDVLRDAAFLGVGAECGERTVFKINAISAVSVKRFSDFGMDFEYYAQPVDKHGKTVGQNEDEYMLAPGSTFIIVSIVTYPDGVTEVELTEVASALTAAAMAGDAGGAAVSAATVAAAQETSSVTGSVVQGVSVVQPLQPAGRNKKDGKVQKQKQKKSSRAAKAKAGRGSKTVSILDDVDGEIDEDGLAFSI